MSDRCRDTPRPLDREGCRALADALGDTPQTVMAAYPLRRRLCRAYCVGDPSRFEAAVVDSDFCPREFQGWGDDVDALWRLLRRLDGWFCIEVAQHRARPLGHLIEQELAGPVSYLDDIFHTLTRPAQRFAHPAVRLLTVADWPLLAAAPPEIRGAAFKDPRELLAESVVAGAIIADRLVAIAPASARSASYVDIGVYTLPEWRRQGLGCAAVSLVAQRLHAAGLTPVWSTGETNRASRGLAGKIGFREVGRMTYVILDRERGASHAAIAPPPAGL